MHKKVNDHSQIIRRYTELKQINETVGVAPYVAQKFYYNTIAQEQCLSVNWVAKILNREWRKNERR